MKDKKAIIRLNSFLSPPIFHRIKYKLEQELANTLISKDNVGKFLLCQSI